MCMHNGDFPQEWDVYLILSVLIDKHHFPPNRERSPNVLWRLKIMLADNMLAYNVLLTFPERYDITSSYSTSIGLWKINSTGPILQ